MDCPRCGSELAGMRPDAELAPPEIVESLIRYRDHGIPPGDFLQAVLSNDLCDAIGRADSNNLSLLPHIVDWVYNCMPSIAWRNRENVAEWIKTKTAEREGGKKEHPINQISKEKGEDGWEALEEHETYVDSR